MNETKTKIAILYDFDKTLCTKDMQEYTFIPKIKMKSKDFWKESNEQAKDEKMDSILSYMYLMLKKSDMTKQSIHREDFVLLGKDLEYYPGVEEWFDRINSFCRDMNVIVEHYIISSGLKEIIEGSSIYKYFKTSKKESKHYKIEDRVFACEFLYDPSDVACWPKVVVNYTTKTQFLFRINKGILDISNDEDLNKFTPEDERYIPFRNMIYIGDGYTDVPCMKLVKLNGGHSIAVYKNGKRGNVSDLLKNERVDFLALADYTEKSELDTLVIDIIKKIVMVDSLKRKNKKQIEKIGE